jgi:hypothetical protein
MIDTSPSSAATSQSLPVTVGHRESGVPKIPFSPDAWASTEGPSVRGARGGPGASQLLAARCRGRRAVKIRKGGL